jgi:hypothetical protein
VRRSYQLSKWIRRAETAHRKLVELTEEIEASDGETELWALASSAHCEAFQLLNSIEAEKETGKI